MMPKHEKIYVMIVASLIVEFISPVPLVFSFGGRYILLKNPPGFWILLDNYTAETANGYSDFLVFFCCILTISAKTLNMKERIE
jgi:hypothetical protein